MIYLTSNILQIYEEFIFLRKKVLTRIYTVVTGKKICETKKLLKVILGRRTSVRIICGRVYLTFKFATKMHFTK